jgi:hypothetical protein
MTCNKRDDRFREISGLKLGDVSKITAVSDCNHSVQHLTRAYFLLRRYLYAAR